MASSGPRSAHLVHTLDQHLHVLNGGICARTPNTEGLTELARVHSQQVFDLLNRAVFTHRVQRHEPADKEQLALRSAEEMFGVIAQHELTFLGRDGDRPDIDDDIGPFGQARLLIADVVQKLHLEGRLDAEEITDAILAIEEEFVRGLEAIFGRDVHATGLGQRAAEPVLRSLNCARGLLKMHEAPAKNVVASDMDGVLAVLRPREGHPGGPLRFGDTRLGFAVQQNAEQLERELTAEGTGDARERDTEMGLLPYFTQRHGALMERQWGDEAKERIREIYVESYPASRFEDALRDAKQHINRMPLAYHVFRHKTWDHRFEDVYEMDTTPGAFAVRVLERGGRLIFITAAPKIHALKMLKASGVMDAVGPEGFELFTVEDLYQEGTVEDGTFVEGDKGTLLAEWCSVHGVDKERVAMAGDQYHSDVEPVIAQGIQARIVNGPHELDRYLASIRLPKDKPA